MAETIKREVKKASDTAKTTAKKTTEAAKATAEKAADTAEKKTQKVVKYTTDTAKKTSGKAPVAAKKNENATGLRIGAVVLWVLAIVCEIMAILVFTGKVELPLPIPTAWIAVIFIVLDLIFLIIGSQLWKRANHKDPVSEKNKLKFWLWNNMGVIVAIVAFLPLLIIALTDKNADKESKKIVAIAAAAALVIGAVCGIDYHPMSEEKANTAETILQDTTVYWTSGGARYHLDDDCQALSNSATLTYGTVHEAIHTYAKDYLCKFCMNRHLEENENLANLVYGAE